MFGIKISPKTYFETRKFVKEATKQLQSENCQKVAKRVAKDGTVVLLGYKKDATHFASSIAKMPNGDILGKTYETGSFWLPFETKYNQILSKIIRANNPNVPVIDKLYRSEQFGKNAKPIIYKEIKSNLGYSKNIIDTGTGIRNVEHFFAKTGHLTKRTFQEAGELVSRSAESVSK